MYFAGVYLFAWTPYTVVSIKMAFFGISKTTNMEFKLLAFFAKTSFIFNPLVYIGFHPPYRWEYVHFLIQTFVTIADERAYLYGFFVWCKSQLKFLLISRKNLFLYEWAHLSKMVWVGYALKHQKILIIECPWKVLLPSPQILVTEKVKSFSFQFLVTTLYIHTYIYNNYGFCFINLHLAVSKIVRCNVCLAWDTVWWAVLSHNTISQIGRTKETIVMTTKMRTT